MTTPTTNPMHRARSARYVMNAKIPLLWLGLLALGACEFNLTNPNTPLPIGPNPSRAEVAAASTGLIISAREEMANWVLKAGIFGREAIRIDVADPRFVTELLVGPLDPGSRAFGGGEWELDYRTIRGGYNIVNVIGTADPAQVSVAEQSAVQGFVQTMQALSYLIVLDSHTEDSIPINVNQPITAPPAPFVTNAAAYAHVVQLLDSARTALLAGGSAFPFTLPSGFTGFNTPTTFLKFNRALMARVQVYRASPNAPGVNCTACWDSALTALAASFVDTTASLSLGVYFNYTTGAGDIVNALSQDPASAVDLVHPMVRDSVETQQAPSTARDLRYLAKVTPRAQGALTIGAHSSDISWILYPSPSSPIPIIRNEELVLLQAEADLGKADYVNAANLINFIRVKSGNVAAIAGLATQTPAQILGQLLKQKLYSLMYEGGHRWIDMRRYGRLNQLLVTAGDQVFPTLPIPLSEVLARQ
jgi:starch-binding outer membrane protein, SusD/RagB family